MYILMKVVDAKANKLMRDKVAEEWTDSRPHRKQSLIICVCSLSVITLIMASWVYRYVRLSLQDGR